MRLNSDVLNRITYLIGSAEIAARLPDVRALTPFNNEIIDFLNDVSREIIRDPRGKEYSDVVTFGFWIRKGSVMQMKDRFIHNTEKFRLSGKGTVFHVAPSNVPVNFAYSLALGLLTGNANVVRVPSNDFPQVKIITDAFIKAFELHKSLVSYVLCVRYGHDKEVNDLLSSVADVRIIWGGDQTIEELRKSPLPPRSNEITFADRYSIAVIDSDAYLKIEDKSKVAQDFYNDTYFSDQNACTSPRIVVWLGKNTEKAKEVFWEKEHEVVKKKYMLQDIQAVNKLTKGCLVSAIKEGVSINNHTDNLIVRVKVSGVDEDLMSLRDNSGFFYEYDCDDITELIPLVDDKKCQTISYIGNHDLFNPLIFAGIKGVDRIVPVGKTMDFDFIWDGYNLFAQLTRVICIT